MTLRPRPRVLDLDVCAQRPGVRVEDDDGTHLLLRLDRDLPRDRLHGRVERARGDRGGVAELVACVLVRGLDRRAGERVVKLVEEHELPGLRQLAERIRPRAERVRDRAPLLRPLEQVLRPPVPALDPRVRRVAAGRVVLELAAHGRMAVPRRRVEERTE